MKTVLRVPRGHFLERGFDLSGAALPRTVHDGGEHGEPSRPPGIKVRWVDECENASEQSCPRWCGGLQTRNPRGAARSSRFPRFHSRSGRQLPIRTKRWCLRGGLQDLAISSDEASSRNFVISGWRACRPGQWRCRGIHSKTRRACACRVGGCWPDLRYDHFGWRTRVVDGAATPRAVGGDRSVVLGAEPVDRRRTARSSVSGRVHAELGRGNSGDSVEAACDGLADAPCPSRGQTSMTAVP